jgi:acyl carrier protein
MIRHSARDEAMLDIPTKTKRDRIDMVVREFVKGEARDKPLDDATKLEELGLTSMDMVNLMLAVEAEFDLTIPGSKLIPANFRTLAAIADLVDQLAP